MELNGSWRKRSKVDSRQSSSVVPIEPLNLLKLKKWVCPKSLVHHHFSVASWFFMAEHRGQIPCSDPFLLRRLGLDLHLGTLHVHWIWCSPILHLIGIDWPWPLGLPIGHKPWRKASLGFLSLVKCIGLYIFIYIYIYIFIYIIPRWCVWKLGLHPEQQFSRGEWWYVHHNTPSNLGVPHWQINPSFHLRWIIHMHMFGFGVNLGTHGQPGLWIILDRQDIHHFQAINTTMPSVPGWTLDRLAPT